MTTSTLHLNNPVPSNGAVVPSLGGRHTVTVTLAGVGAISCVVQAWGSEQGTDSRKIGAPVTVSGTTTVSQTLTFDADCKQFWLQLVSLSPACKFNATVENDGSTYTQGPVNAPNIRRQKSSGVWTPSPNPRYLSAGSVGTIAQIIAKAPHRFSRLKVAFGSTNNGAAYNVTNCALGVTKTPDVMTPSTGGTVTGDGATGLVSAISAPLAVAQNPGLFVSRVWTPWVPMPAVQADDGFWYWLCRYEFSGVGAAYGQGVAADGWRRDDTGNWWAMKRVTTGVNQFFGADAAAFGPAADATAYQAFAHVVQADFGGCGEGQVSVGAFGASTMTAGGDNTGSFIERTNGVCFGRGNGISLVGMAQPNATTAQIYDDIVARGLNTEFDVILMPVFSSNDGYTEGLVLKQVMRALNIRDMAARYGQKVLFVILPHNGAAATPGLLAIREKAETILFTSGGVIDLCPLIQGASRYVWDAAWSDDGVHPNLTGRDRLKLLAPDVIIRAVREIVQ